MTLNIILFTHVFVEISFFKLKIDVLSYTYGLETNNN